MRNLCRRDFLNYAGMGSISLFSKNEPLGFLGNALAEEVREYKLNASVTPVDLGAGKSFKAWTYNGQVPGP